MGAAAYQLLNVKNAPCVAMKNPSTVLEAESAGEARASGKAPPNAARSRAPTALFCPHFYGKPASCIISKRDRNLVHVQVESNSGVPQAAHAEALPSTGPSLPADCIVHERAEIESSFCRGM